MLLQYTRPDGREVPRKNARRTGERRSHFEALLARSYAQMRARQNPRQADDTDVASAQSELA